MVDREHFDEFLRKRAHKAGAHRYTGTFKRIERDADGTHVIYRDKVSGNELSLKASYVIGADGARSDVGRQEVPGRRQDPLRHRLPRDHQGPRPQRPRRRGAEPPRLRPDPLRRGL